MYQKFRILLGIFKCVITELHTGIIIIFNNRTRMVGIQNSSKLGGVTVLFAAEALMWVGEVLDAELKVIENHFLRVSEMMIVT